MYYNILTIANWVFFGLMCLSFVFLLYKIIAHIYAFSPPRKFREAKVNHKFAILIAARDESKVIEKLLQSLDNSTYPKECFDAYVIVEEETDPTVEICKKYPFVTSFVRPNLDVKRKGAALDQVIKHIIKTGINKEKGYEAYFIFDADNIIDKNYLSEMNKTFDAGYDVGLGYRNTFNWNDGWVASCSALTFSTLNTCINKFRARVTKNILVSGTGFYIAAKVLHELGGFPFQTMADDADLSYYATLNNLKGAYNENAVFYDEQPVSLKTSINQRVRWVKGYSEVMKKYRKDIVKAALHSKENRIAKIEFAMNIVPVAIPVASIIAYILFTLVLGIVGVAIGVPTAWWSAALINCGITILSTYVFFVLYAGMLLILESRHIKIKFTSALSTCLMYPFFMGLYIPIAIKAVSKKEIVWDKVQRQN